MDPATVRTVLDRLDGRMGRDLHSLWRSAADRAAGGQFRALIIDAYPEVVTPYSSAAAELGAELYESAPTSRPGHRLVEGELPPVERLQRSAGWALDVGHGRAGLDLLANSATRALFDGLRNTIVANTEAEPGATWRRYASATACGFCRTLATRGSEYTSSYTSAAAATTVVGRRGRTRGNAEMGAAFHDSCKCLAVMVRPGQTWEPPDYYDRWWDDYTAARDSLGPDADLQQIAAAMDKMPGGRHHRG